jgi:lysophospholipase L1-like esterase
VSRCRLGGGALFLRVALAAATGALAVLLAAAVATDAAAAPAKSTKKKTTRKQAASRPAPIRVSSASIDKVTEVLKNPPQGVLHNPGALVPFFELLARASAPDTSSRVRTVHFGDSHTASDDWTGTLRGLLQARFGNAGSGFSYAGYPFLGYRRFDARGGGTRLWTTLGLSRGEGDGLFGLGGVAITASRAGQSVWLDTEGRRIEIFYLQQPSGGRVGLYDNDEFVRDFSTAGETAPAVVEYTAAGGPRRLRLQTLDSRPVRLFGWVAENGPGITYEALGINGAEATLMLKWDLPVFQALLKRRDPALVVLAYGTNEAGHPAWTYEGYLTAFAGAVARIRDAVPAASILVIGPPDRFLRARGRWLPLVTVDKIVNAQKRVAQDLGCAFWDLRERMGGLGSMHDWVYAGLAQADHVHFTTPGYQRLAAVLYADLMGQYEVYSKARLEPGDLK